MGEGQKTIPKHIQINLKLDTPQHAFGGGKEAGVPEGGDRMQSHTDRSQVRNGPGTSVLITARRVAHE